MITLYIVDDEKTTRDSIKEFIPWKDLGVGAVKTASNGMTALELAAQIRPDIVLTDVRMPKMDGIELSKKLRELYPECKIIFISGYSDKEYLKSAINLKAVSYIEKPLNIEEIAAVIREAVQICLQEEKKRNDEIEIRNRLNENLPLIFQEITFDFIKENADLAAIKTKYHVPLAGFSESGRYIALCAAFNWAFGLDACAKSESKSRILNALYEAGAGLPPAFAAGFIEDDRLAFIAPAGCVERQASAKLLLDAVGRVPNEGYTVSAGVGKDACPIGEIPESYRIAAESVKMQFYGGSGNVYGITNFGGAKYSPDRSLIKSFRDAMRGNHLSAALQLVEKLTDRVRELKCGDIENIKNVYFHLLLTVFETAREKELIGSAEENEQCYIWQEIERIRFLPELSDYLQNNMKAVLAQTDKDGSENKKIFEINRFIRENFSDRQLSVQAVAHNIFLNHQYLCSYYKKATGKTVNDYITEIRMEKAKELLLDKRSKILDVTARVGLTDPNYFSTLFKKYAGCTPSEYRERN